MISRTPTGFIVEDDKGCENYDISLYSPEESLAFYSGEFIIPKTVIWVGSRLGRHGNPVPSRQSRKQLGVRDGNLPPLRLQNGEVAEEYHGSSFVHL